jgi:CRISPR-associated protein Cmr6
MKNLGYTFYKRYFKNLEFNRNDAGDYLPSLKVNETKDIMHELFDSNLSDYSSPATSLGNKNIKLITTYPGLLIGSGYNHEIGDQKNELKLGFFFDHTTGLPCIPGSSVKGVLRDACEKNEGQYILSILKELANGERTSELKDDEKKVLEDEKQSEKILGKISLFVMQVFEGKIDKENFIPFKERDIFFDAFPINSQNENGKFLANDYITPHPNPLKNPIPIQFLKVLPQVVFQFNFKLSDKPFSKKIKFELFRQILLDLGVGAKTNVGYGQLTDKFSISQSSNSEKSAHEQNNKTGAIHSIPKGVKLKKNEEYKASFTGLAGEHAYFKFSKDGKECLVNKKLQKVYEKLRKKGYEGELKEGDEVTIKIQADYLSDKEEVSFQVLILGSIN